jgi:hypothetical protein
VTFNARRMLIVAAFVFLAAVYLLAQWRDLGRGPHVDEVEHLHVAVLMERGERVYVDFAEHHPPLFWAMLRPLVPATEGVAAMQTLVTRARLLAGLVTAIAIFSAALIVWRASMNVWTVVTFVGLVFAAGGVWRNGLGDVRPDSMVLALWWSGAALVLLAQRPTLKGVGIGLVFLASLVKPQWPLSSIVIGVVFLVHVRRSFVRASAVAVLIAAAGIGATALIVDLRAVWFHVITLTSTMVEMRFPAGPAASAFSRCPAIVRPPGVFLAAIIVGLYFGVRRPQPPLSDDIQKRQLRLPHSKHLTVVILLIALASICEIYFIYPALDFRFYAFWVIAAAAVLALAPLSIKHLPIAASVIAMFLSLDLIDPPRAQPDVYWRSSSWIASRLAPGDTIWNGWSRHPIDARDASYYWFWEVIPAAVRLSPTEFLPPITEADLPPCRLDPSVRFIGEPNDLLPIAKRCFERLRDSGRITPTPFGDLWMVRR